MYESALDTNLVSELPLEDWLFNIAERLAARRIAKLPIQLSESSRRRALEAVFDLFHTSIPDLLIGIPRTAAGTNNLSVRFRISWRHYRNLARAADDCLVRVFHIDPSDSLDRAF